MASSEEYIDAIEIDSNTKELQKSTNLEKTVCFNNENNNFNIKNGLNISKCGEKLEISQNDEIVVTQSSESSTMAVNDEPLISAGIDKAVINIESVSGTGEIKSSHKTLPSAEIASVDTFRREHDKSHVHLITKANPTAVSQGIVYGNINETVVISTLSRDDGKLPKNSKSRDNGRLCLLFVTLQSIILLRFFLFLFLFTEPQSHKKKKKDRDRNKSKDKDKLHRKQKQYSKPSPSVSTSNVLSSTEPSETSNNNNIDNRNLKIDINNYVHIDQQSKSSNSKESESHQLLTAKGRNSPESSFTENSLNNESASINSSELLPNNQIQRADVWNEKQNQVNPLVTDSDARLVEHNTEQEIENSNTSTNQECVSSPLISSLFNERKIFTPANTSVIKPSSAMPDSVERTPAEGAAGIVIKKDYLPSPAKTNKTEKTRDDVARVLNYDLETNFSKDPSNVEHGIVNNTKQPNSSSIKTEKLLPVQVKQEPVDTSSNETTLLKSISENKENANGKMEIKKIKEEVQTKSRSDTMTLTNSTDACGTHEKRSHDKNSSNRETRVSHHQSSSSSKPSSSSKSSSSRHNSSSSRDCSRCYRRSKIKRVSTGIQCRRFGESVETIAAAMTPNKLTQVPATQINSGVYANLKYGRYFHIEVHSNGGATILHLYQSELDNLSPTEMNELVEEFFQVVFSENEDGWAHHVMGKIHVLKKKSRLLFTSNLLNT